jgi:hypothetical protein
MMQRRQRNLTTEVLPFSELFREDRTALLPLPDHRLTPVRLCLINADGFGKSGSIRHYYSTSPKFAGQELLVALRAHSIDIVDEHKRLIVRHSRVFGERRSDSCDYALARVLMNIPGAWKNSGIGKLIPDTS